MSMSVTSATAPPAPPAARPLRALHVAAGKLYGGVESVLVTMARCRELAPGLEPTFALAFEGRFADELRASGVEVPVVGPVRFGRPWTVLAARRRLARLIREVQPDVVVCHACWPHALAGPVARRAGVPLVHYQHDRYERVGWLERLASRTRPDLVVVNSRTSAETTGLLFSGVRTVQATYAVPAPSPPEGSRAEVRRELGTPEETVVIVQACRLERWKGHALLLEGLGLLADRPGWEAWVAGGAQRPHEQAYLDELTARLEALGLGGRVRFLGQRSDVPRLLAAADIHCQPNIGPEPFGVAYVEALYAGLPVVSTRMGGASEIVTESCGVLVEPGDAAGLARALSGLIDDPSARARLGAAGPSRAAELCGPAPALGRLAEILGSLRQGGVDPR